MLAEKTKYKYFRVGDKRFRAVELNLEGGNLPSQKTKKKAVIPEKEEAEIQARSAGLDYIDDFADNRQGWINVGDEASSEDHNKYYEDEAPCAVKSQEDKDTEEARFAEEVDEAPTDFTHFFCIPLCFPEFKNQFLSFKRDLYRLYDDKFDDNLQNENLLHLTLMMLKLNDKKMKQINRLNDRIQELIRSIVHDQPLELEFSNCGMFKRKTKDSGLVYLGLKDNKTHEIIRNILNAIINLLIEEKILDPAKDLSRIKYNKLIRKYELETPHVTLMKSSWVKTVKPKHSNLEPVYEKVKNFNWRSVHINSIDLSIRGQYGEDGFYRPLKQFSLKQ